jgi:hypothetical protein
MSNLKYKVGDRFVSNSGIEVTIIKKNKENDLDPYKIDYLDGDYGYCNDITIEKYYTKIEENKMNIEENKHHLLWKGMQSLDVMKLSLTKEEYIGFLKGQILKYQLRLGKKDDVAKELKKIQDYTNELNKMLDEESNN